MVTAYTSDQFFAWTAREKAGEVTIFGMESGVAYGRRKKEEGKSFLWRLSILEKCAASAPLPPRPAPVTPAAALAEFRPLKQTTLFQ